MIINSFIHSVGALFGMLRSSAKCLALLGFLWIPWVVWSQEYSFQLTDAETALFETALKSLSNKSYGYLAVRGQGESFYVVKNQAPQQKVTWESLKGGVLELASWIANNPAFNDKDVVLLSSCNQEANQKLANFLWQEDQKVDKKRKKRNIIGWDGSVILFANGYIKGYTNCYAYAPADAVTKSKKEWPTPAAISLINTVTLDEKQPFIEFSEDVPLLSRWLDTWTPEVQTGSVDEVRTEIKKRIASLKSGSRDVYDKLVARQCRDANCFKGWAYLWDLNYRTQISNDPDLASSAAVVHDKYTRNPKLDYLAYEKHFRAFLRQDSRASKITTIKNFEFNPQKPSTQLTPDDFEQIAEEAARGVTLADFWALNGVLPNGANATTPNVVRVAPTDLKQRQLLLIASSEPRLAEELRKSVDNPKNYQVLPVLSNCWQDILTEVLSKDYIKGTTQLEPARRALMAPINKRIGNNLKSFEDLLLLTNPILDEKNLAQGLIKNPTSWGSIFEYWVSKNVLTTENKGKKSFFFGVDGKIYTSDPKPIQSKEHIIDNHYMEGDNIVAVEMKHYQLSDNSNRYKKIDIDQLDRYAKLVKNVKVTKVIRVEYVFSFDNAGKAQEDAFLALFPTPTDRKEKYQAYFIDKTQLEPVNFVKIKK